MFPMQDFMEKFHPRIINVFQREEEFWKQNRGQVNSKCTRLLSFLYAYRGKGILELNGVRYPLAPGCFFQIPLKHELILKSSSSNCLCYFTVQYDFKLIEWDGSDAYCNEPAMKHLPFDFVIPMPDSEWMRSSMHRLYQIWNEKKSGYRGKANLAFMSILQHVFDVQHQQHKENANEQAIMECVRYIEQHYSKPFDRDELARRASLSSSYFSILFKRYVSCSPVQYVTRVRMDRAMQLLRESNLSVAEIASEVGFRDPLYFSRVFTQSIGVTPREYRNA